MRQTTLMRVCSRIVGHRTLEAAAALLEPLVPTVVSRPARVTADASDRSRVCVTSDAPIRSRVIKKPSAGRAWQI